jgi:chemosensory pili system protein ChpA (sensor histidine kinase/response regulator)
MRHLAGEAMLAADPKNTDPREPPRVALVLIVDDDADVRGVTAAILSRHGYDVVEAADGRGALACLVKRVPDLVILDLNMPLMNGWEFRAEQRQLADERLAAIPVLLLTGEAAPEQEATRLNAAGFVQKPYEPEDLLGAVNAALDERSKRPIERP